ncbi:concanavalin A-like lectin/glucanase domain-containing protein [Chaetomium tenue]|uniref:Concanavalin A-like lectin/glucanase domain-containing protein n=1 Tax=Chaetomium tenue TaxID=1854479 RepID=A0ACB7P130_9PEZI|nr:concanavalin A-like lectin/glucanase domain-containing protein [Chaetomium globosum]
MHQSLLTSFLALGFSAAQQVGNYQNETHPTLQWSSCGADGSCEKVDGEVTIDADFRWLHRAGTVTSCFDGNAWNERGCNSVDNCTANCALEGADYVRSYGVKTSADTLSQRFRTNFDFAYNIGSRLFLMESQHRYQTFTLRDNELAFDVDLSTVECGINSALYFVSMDADGGMARYPTNAAGAEYGTGYCDASCTRSVKFVGGKANVKGWIPSETDQFSGKGNLGSCCPQFSVWNSNAHSFAMSSHVCVEDGPQVCWAGDCLYNEPYAERGPGRCDATGCSYNPYRMGNKEFYGKGKTVDTAQKFTVVTQFTATKVTQFLVQNNTRFDIPSPTFTDLPQEAGLSRDMCVKQFDLFAERDIMSELGGWEHHQSQLLDQPLVMVMSIGADVSTPFLLSCLGVLGL